MHNNMNEIQLNQLAIEMAHLVLEKIGFQQTEEVYQQLVKQIYPLFNKPLAKEILQVLDHSWFKTFIREIDGQILAQLPCDSAYKNIAYFFENIYQEIVFSISEIIADFNTSNHASSDALHLNSEIKIAVRKCLKQAAQPFTSDDPIKHYLLLLVSHLMELSIIPQNVIKLFPHTVTISLSQPRSLPEVMEDYISKAKGMTMVIKM